MIPEVKFVGDLAHIPIYGSDNTVRILRPEGDVNKDILGHCYCEFRINICYDSTVQADNENFEWVKVYTVSDHFTKQKFYLIYDGDPDFDDLIHTVCVPFNRLNLYRFYKDNLMTFQNQEMPIE